MSEKSGSAGKYDEAIEALRQELLAEGRGDEPGFAAPRAGQNQNPQPSPRAIEPDGPAEFEEISLTDEQQLLVELRAEARGGVTAPGASVTVPATEVAGTAISATAQGLKPIHAQSGRPSSSPGSAKAAKTVGGLTPVADGRPKEVTVPRSGEILPAGLGPAIQFYRQLGNMLKAGLSFDRALPLAGDVGGARYRRRARVWAQGCTEGSPLWEQMYRDGESVLRVALVRAGEATGRLPDLCFKISEYLEHLRKLRNMAVQRMIKPLAMIHAVLIMPGLVTWIKSAIGNGKVGAEVIFAGPIIFWCCVIGFVVALKMLRFTGIFSRLALVMPLRYLAMPFIEMNVCEILSAALAAGFLPRDACDLAGMGCGNQVVGDRLRAAGRAIERAEMLSLTEAVHYAGMSDMTISLFHTGEKSGTLEKSLAHAALAASESFRMRTEWTLRVVMAILYTIAGGCLVYTIIMMWASYAQGMAAMANDI